MKGHKEGWRAREASWSYLSVHSLDPWQRVTFAPCPAVFCNANSVVCLLRPSLAQSGAGLRGEPLGRFDSYAAGSGHNLNMIRSPYDEFEFLLTLFT